MLIFLFEVTHLFISNQKHIVNSAINAIFTDKRRAAIINGVSGVGKSFVLQQIEELTKKNHDVVVFYITGDMYLSNRPYFPFNNFIKSIYISDNSALSKSIINSGVKTSLPNAAKSIPIAGELVSAVVDVALTKKQNLTATKQRILNETEIQLLMKLEYIAEGKESLFFLEDIQYWDTDSLELLSIIVNNNANQDILNNSYFIATLKLDSSEFANQNQALTNVVNQLKHSCFTILPVVNKEYADVLFGFGLKNDLTKDVIDAIYSITHGHLQMTKDIIQSANDYLDNPTAFLKIIEERDVQKIIEDRLVAFGANGSLIDEMLKYGALFGQSFSVYEIQNILSKNESEVRHLVNQANEMYFVNKTSHGAAFVHEVIRELFKKKADQEQYIYYKTFADALKFLRPSEFIERAENLLKAGAVKEAVVLYVIHYISMIRQEAQILSSDKNFELFIKNSEYYEFYRSMEKAYKAYYRSEYNKCIDELNAIDDIYESELIAEKNYLLSISYSKFFNNTERTKAVDVLLPYVEKSSVNNETDVWQRIMSALLIAHIHKNDIVSATKLEKLLMYDLSMQIKYDINSAAKLNIIRRKSSATHMPHVACKLIAKSISFFGPRKNDINETPYDVKEYYMALTNYAANSLCASNYEDGFNKASELLKLPMKYKNLTFERVFMPLNNYVILGFLSEKLSLSEAHNYMLKISMTKNMQDVDKSIINVNFAIFEALTGNLEGAFQMLVKQKKMVDSNDHSEYYYKNLIYTNYLAIAYLINKLDNIYEEAEKFHKEILMTENPYWIKRALLFKDLVASDYTSKSPLDWFSNAFQAVKSDLQTLHFYSRGFLFGEMEYWSES